MRRASFRRAAAALSRLVVGLGLLLLTQAQPALGQGYGTSSGQSSGGYSGSQSSGGGYPADITTYDSYFQPVTLLVPPGQSATLHLWNAGSRPHSFSLDVEGIDVVIPPGQGRDVNIRFPSGGWLTYYCKFHFQTDAMYGFLKAS